MIRKLATASEIQIEMQSRIRASPELDEASRDLLRAPMPTRIEEHGHGGCNWAAPEYRGSEQLERFMAALVQAAQEEFNLPD